jgi:hypothetical protein
MTVPVSDHDLAWMRAALTEHLHLWWAGDALKFARAQKRPGQIDGALVRNIAKDYAVNRLILTKTDGNTGITKLLNAKFPEWPDTLSERSNFVRELSETALQRGYTGGYLVSAFSKIIWFMAPTGWTMFDRFASTGLGVPNLRSAERMQEFYKTLEHFRFADVVEKMRPIINRSAFPALWPERIVDKYLMFCGKDETDRHTAAFNLKVFRAATGKAVCAGIDELSRELHQALGQEDLFKRHGEMVWEKK